MVLGFKFKTKLGYDISVTKIKILQTSVFQCFMMWFAIQPNQLDE
jgi:hypothetical protein